MAKEVTFSELDSFLSKINDKGSIITKNNYSKIDEWINTGNFLLNAQLSGSLFGGIPNSRSVCFAGESGTGKTFLALNVCREAQKMDYNIIYCDSEAAVDEDTIKNFGVDPEKFRYQPVATPSEVRHFVANLCDHLKGIKSKGGELPKIMLVLDSLGNLATTKERADAASGNEKRDMTKQQELRSLFRVITADLAEFKIPFIFTNHTYATIGSYVPGQTISGGGGAIYNASIITMLSKSTLREEATENNPMGVQKTGIIVTSKIAKNRFARPIPVKFHISFYKGMNPYVGLETFINWESCGIQRGKIIDENTYQKYYTKGGPNDEEIKGTRFVVNENGEEKAYYFEAKERGRKIAVRHLCAEVPPNELFTPKVITTEVLQLLDETVIKKTFKLPDITDLDGIEDEEIMDVFDDNE